jgi:hypothetical protein
VDRPADHVRMLPLKGPLATEPTGEGADRILAGAGSAMPPTRRACPLPKAGRLRAPTSLRVGHATGAFPCEETPHRVARTNVEQPAPGDM